MQESYRASVKKFIDDIKDMPNTTVTVNAMSTTLFGEYQDIMPALKKAMLSSLQEIPQSIFVIKLSGGCH